MGLARWEINDMLITRGDWMSKKFYKFAQFVGVKDYGNRELRRVNSGIDVKH